MRPPQDHELSAGEAAARWLIELRNGDGASRADFFAWLQKSPRHVEEFLFATAMWRTLRQLGQKDPLRVEELLAQAAREHAQPRIVALHSERVPVSTRPADYARRPAYFRRRAPAMAASVATTLVAVTGGLFWFATLGTTYATGTAEQRTVRLDDGSIVVLNTRSRLRVRYSERTRDIRLIDGEALFTVHHDASRPFRVQSGNSVVQAVGTQFNVYRQSTGTTVSVLEGVVQISAAGQAPRLKAGEQANIAVSGQVDKHPTADVARATAWRERKLIFRSDRLEDVVTEVNRYSTRQIHIDGTAARELRISAIFDANDPESLLRFLQKLDAVTIEFRPDTIVIHARHDNPSPHNSD